MTEAGPSREIFTSILPIRAKLALIGLAVTMATLASGVVSYRTERELAERSKYLYDNILLSVSYARLAQTEFERLNILVRQCAAVREAVAGVEDRRMLPRVRERAREQIDVLCQRLSEEAGAGDPTAAASGRLSEVVANLNVAAERNLSTEASRELGLELDADVAALIRRLGELERPAMEILRSDSDVDGDAVIADMAAFAEELDLFIANLAAAGAVQQDRIERSAAQGARRILTAVGVSVLMGLAAAFVIGEWIVRQLRTASDFSRRVADGHLDTQLEVRGDTELSALMRALDAMRVEIKRRMSEIEAMRARSDQMVDNMLPAPIAERMRSGETRIADGRAEATIVFIDIVGFTRLTQRLGASHLVETLDGVFSAMDEAAEACGVEKIKTIGDAYMAAAGVVNAPSNGDAEACARFALRAREIVREAGERLGYPIETRAGIHNGPAVAGVLGKSRLVFDLWGEAVNLASRLESSGQPGDILVSEACYWRLRSLFGFEELGEIELKGVGSVTIFRLLGAKSETDESADDAKVTPLRVISSGQPES